MPSCPLRNACVWPAGMGQVDQEQQQQQKQQLRKQATFHNLNKYSRKEVVGCHAAIASRLTPTV